MMTTTSMNSTSIVKKEGGDDNSCVLCLDPIRIPVELTCFPCSGPHTTHRHCYSIHRVCLHCARQYLQLNEPRHKRKTSLRCLFCPATANPQTLNAENSYKKDYRMMAMDRSCEYKCIHDHRRCAFKGTQIELEKHVQTACEYRMCFCTDCMVRYRANSHHIFVCKARVTCRECGDRILKTQCDLHFEREHHQRKCVYCRKMYDMDYIRDHEKRGCLQRPIPCSVCDIEYKSVDMYNHLRDHLSCCHDTIQKIKNQMSEEGL